MKQFGQGLPTPAVPEMFTPSISVTCVGLNNSNGSGNPVKRRIASSALGSCFPVGARGRSGDEVAVDGIIFVQGTVQKDGGMVGFGEHVIQHIHLLAVGDVNALPADANICPVGIHPDLVVFKITSVTGAFRPNGIRLMDVARTNPDESLR